MTRLKVMALLFLLVALAGLPLYAQSPSTTGRIVVNIPFEFVVGDMTLPPGDYTILHVTTGVLQFIGPSGSHFVLTGDVYAASTFANSQLVFKMQGNTYVLHQIVPAGQTQGHDLAHANGVPDI